MRFYANQPPLWRGNSLKFNSPSLRAGKTLLLSSASFIGVEPCAVLPPTFFANSLATSTLAVGTVLAQKEQVLFAVTGRFYLPLEGDAHSAPVVRLQALEDVAADVLNLEPQRSGPAVAWVTVSDKGSIGQRKDASGPAVATMAEALKPRCINGYIVPDDIHRLRSLISDLALTQGYDLIVTSGGTGLSPRDVTPEALLPLLEKRIYGLEQAMLQSSLAVTPRAALSRPVCGSLGASMVLTLPGSVKAARENFEAVIAALGHGLEKLQGSPSDCGG